MKAILKALACLLVSAGGSTGINAQFSNVPKYQFGVGVGAMIYQGDLTPESAGAYKTMKPTIHLFAAKLLNSSFAVRANLAIGALKADDAKYDHPAYRQQRNFNFRTPVTEITATGEWNMLARNYRSVGFAPYLLAGVGYSFLNIKRDYSNLNAAYFSPESALLTGLPDDIAHTVPKGLLVFPVGAGVRYYFSDKIGISAETMYRISNTDYLDGFSQSVNPAKKDNYYSHTIGIVYRLGKKNMLDCPVVRY